MRSVSALNPKTFDYVACCYADKLFCLLSKDYADCVINQLLVQTNEDVTRDKVVTLEVGDGGPNLFSQDKKEEKQKKAKKTSDRKSKWRGDKLKKYCLCNTCVGTPLYDVNMSRGGP